MNNCNNLSSQIDSIDFIQLNIFSQNNSNLKDKVDSLKEQLSTIKINNKNIIKNIDELESCYRSSFFKGFRNNYKFVSKQIEIAQNSFNKFKKKYNECSEYGETLKQFYEHYFDLYNKLNNFYSTNFTEKEQNNFRNIIKDKLDDLNENISLFKKLCSKFDLNPTINLLDRLKEQASELISLFQVIYSFKLVLNHFNESEKTIESFIHSNSKTIIGSDYEKIQIIKNKFKNDLATFNTNFNAAFADDWMQNMKETYSSYKSLNEFIEAKKYSDLIINHVVESTKNNFLDILQKKDSFLTFINDAKSIFEKDPTIVDSLNFISDEIKNINDIFKKMQNLNTKNFQGKIDALTNIFNYYDSMLDSKNNIALKFDYLNKKVKNINNLFVDINNTYIQLIQCKSFLSSNDFEQQNVSSWLSEIDNYMQECETFISNLINSNENSLKEINERVLYINDFVKKLIVDINININLQNYSYKLLMFSNQFSIPKLQDKFEQAKRFYEEKQYKKCLNILINIFINQKKTIAKESVLLDDK